MRSFLSLLFVFCLSAIGFGQAAFPLPFNGDIRVHYHSVPNVLECHGTYEKDRIKALFPTADLFIKASEIQKYKIPAADNMPELIRYVTTFEVSNGIVPRFDPNMGTPFTRVFKSPSLQGYGIRERLIPAGYGTLLQVPVGNNYQIPAGQYYKFPLQQETLTILMGNFWPEAARDEEWHGPPSHTDEMYPWMGDSLYGIRVGTGVFDWTSSFDFSRAHAPPYDPGITFEDLLPPIPSPWHFYEQHYRRGLSRGGLFGENDMESYLKWRPQFNFRTEWELSKPKRND